MKSKGQQELDEYIFTRPEMAKLLGITTNALRCRMRKGKCDLEYRFDGNQFKFKRPGRDRVITKASDHPKTSHEKEIYDYMKGVDKRLNRGATHKGQGKYPNEAFKLQNQMKILNHIQGKFKSEEHRKRFERLNEKALEKVDQDIQKDLLKSSGGFHGRPKYGGMIRGHSQSWYDLPYEIDKEPPPSSSFHIGGKPYGEQEGYGNYAPSEEEKQKPIITWDEPVIKDPGADYKPGKFKFLDEQIKKQLLLQE